MTRQTLITLTMLMAMLPFSYGQINSISDLIYPSKDMRWVHFKKGLPITADNIYPNHKKHFGLEETDELVLIRTEKDEIGYRHDRYQLVHKGVEVEHAIWVNHSIRNYPVKANGFLPMPLPEGLATKPEISPNEALVTALGHLVNKYGYVTFAWNDPKMEKLIKEVKDDPEATYFPEPALVITDTDFKFDDYQPQLAYKLEILIQAPHMNKLVYVDALSGEVLKTLNNLHTHNEIGTAETMYSGTREITTDKLETGEYRLRETSRKGGSSIWTINANNLTNLSDTTDFINGDNVWDDFPIPINRAATDAHFMAEFVYDFYLEKFQRNGFDNRGGTILSFMHFGAPDYINAFWNGTYMAYGDAKGSPLSTPDIFAHEFSHAVDQYTASLIYAYEPGALDESFADIFGNTLEYFANPAEASWYMGEQSPVARFRNMADPNEFNDPKRYKGRFWHTADWDNGGVHINSGVQNFWYYLLVEGGTGTDETGKPINVQGIGFEKAIQIAYRNHSTYLTPSSGFADAREGSIQASIDLYGECSPEYEAVISAWFTVGVGDDSQNDDFSLESFTDIPICGEEGESELTFEVNYNGCDTLKNVNLGLIYTIEDLSQSSNESLNLAEVLPRSSFSYSFNNKPDLPLSGRFTIDGRIVHSPDPDKDNNQLVREVIKPVAMQGTEFLPFNGINTETTLLDSVNITSAEQAHIEFRKRVGKDLTKAIFMEGGSRNSYLIAENQDPFEINPTHIARVCMCVDASKSLEMSVLFDRKQEFSSFAEDTLGMNPTDAALLVNSLRVLANGIELSRYSPATYNSDEFSTEQLDLNPFVGGKFELCFEGVTHQNQASDARENGKGERIILDNIRFKGLRDRPDDTSFLGDQPEISYWYYPNPTSGEFNFLIEATEAGLYQLEIFDINGRKLASFEKEASIGKHNFGMDLSGYPEGLYYFRISSGDKQEVAKIIKRD